MFCNSQGLRKLLEVENKLEPLTPGGEQRKPSHKTTARHITCRTLWTTVVRQFCCTALTSTTRKFVQEKLLDRTKMGGVCFSILFQFPSPPRSHYFFVGCEFWTQPTICWIWLLNLIMSPGFLMTHYNNKCGIQRHQFLGTLEKNYSQT